MKKIKWSKQKPKADKEFLLLTANYLGGHYDFKVFTIEFVQYEGNWYYGIFDDGDEWGDYNDLKCDLYCQFELIKK